MLEKEYNGLKKSKAYEKFKEKYPSSYPSIIFATVRNGKITDLNFDFYLPTENKIAGFKRPFEDFKIYPEEVKSLKPQKLKVKLDVCDIFEYSKKAISKLNPSFNLSEVIGTLKEDKWNLICMDRFMRIVKIKANADTGEIINLENLRLSDFISFNS